MDFMFFYPKLEQISMGRAFDPHMDSSYLHFFFLFIWYKKQNPKAGRESTAQTFYGLFIVGPITHISTLHPPRQLIDRILFMRINYVKSTNYSYLLAFMTFCWFFMTANRSYFCFHHGSRMPVSFFSSISSLTAPLKVPRLQLFGVSLQSAKSISKLKGVKRSTREPKWKRKLFYNCNADRKNKLKKKKQWKNL